MNKGTSTKAFTLMEIVVVLAILGVAIGLFALYGQTSQLRADLNSQRDVFVSYLKLAQSSAASGKGSVSHGIHLEDDSYIVFAGDTYVEDGNGNFTLTFPKTLIFDNINLNGAGTDIIFEPPFGETETYGTVDIFSEQINKSIQITINSLGLINY